MAEDKKLTQLIINELTKAQFDALGSNVNEDEIYILTDDEVESLSDGVTIVGDGTSAAPFAIAPEFVDKVNTEIADRTEAITELQEAIQDLEDTKVEKSSLGIASGVATLDANAKVPLSQINDSLIGNVNYQGLYDASTNTPNLDTVAPKGHYYITSVKGTAQGISFEVGDWIISNGTSWDKVDNTDAVSSVNGRTGNVVITKEDIDLSEYTKFTDYATTEKSGTIKTVDSFATDVDGSGFLYAKSKTADNYNTSSDNIFISKGTLENIKSDYVKAGVVSNSNTLTTEEQTSAQNWLGAASKTELQNAVNTLNESIESVTETSEATYVKKAGDTMTGNLIIDRGARPENHIQLWSRSDDDSYKYAWSIGQSSVNNFTIGYSSIFKPSEQTPKYQTFLTITGVGYIIPGQATHIGSSTTKFTDIYVKKINNGADLAVPALGGTLARIEDIPHVTTLPEATAENVNKILQYVGETSDTATQGYFYKNVSTESAEWFGMLMLSTSTEADATITVDSSKLLAQDPVYAGNGTCVISYSDTGWTNWDETFEGETKPVSSLEDWGITVTMNDGSTYTPQGGDYVRVINTTATTYAWEQITVQESFPDQTNNAGKFLTTDGTNVSWNNVLPYTEYGGTSLVAGFTYDKYMHKTTAFGKNITLPGNTSSNTLFGSNIKMAGAGSIGIGRDITGGGVNNTVIGSATLSNTVTQSIIIGQRNDNATISEPKSVIFASYDNDYKILDLNDGTIPTERLASNGTAGQILKKAESGMAWSDLLAEHVNITIGSETTTVKSAIETINSKIPETASSTNLLVDKATLDNAINSFEALPDKTNNNGKVLATNGTDAYWTDAFVKPTDYATDSKAGISKVNAANGIAINSSNTLAISQATVADIETKTNKYNPITPAMLDYAVKAGILANSMQLSTEEKLAAQNWLGFGTITMRTWK